jgi:hypothetical protein
MHATTNAILILSIASTRLASHWLNAKAIQTALIKASQDAVHKVDVSDASRILIVH